MPTRDRVYECYVSIECSGGRKKYAIHAHDCDCDCERVKLAAEKNANATRKLFITLACQTDLNAYFVVQNDFQPEKNAARTHIVNI